jgi:DNA modification methylase
MSRSAHKVHEAEMAGAVARLKDVERFRREERVVVEGGGEQPLPFPEDPDSPGEEGAGSDRPQTVSLRQGDVIDVLRDMPAGRVSTVITSPPYYGLRSYGIPPRKWDDGSECVLGEEDSLERYIHHLVEVFREVKRVLHPRGTCWLNLGDCYAGGGKHVERKEIYNIPGEAKPVRPKQRKLSGKDLLMVPARAALALQSDGWILRNDIIWAKAVSFLPAFSGSVMPESTRDRATWAHEHVFHLALREDYFYDQDACREPLAASTRAEAAGAPYKGRARKAYDAAGAQNPSDVKRRVLERVAASGGRNLRNVWIVPKQNFPGSHFATFPEKLVEPIIKLATSEKGVCDGCAAPIRRRTVREGVPEGVRLAFENSRAATCHDTGRTDGHTARRPNHRRKVLREEWEPSCSCGGAVIPATVLDIFNGSGRTGIVAVKQGRSYIGIDINPEYLKMAAAAIQAAQEKRS